MKTEKFESVETDNQIEEIVKSDDVLDIQLMGNENFNIVENVQSESNNIEGSISKNNVYNDTSDNEDLLIKQMNLNDLIIESKNIKNKSREKKSRYEAYSSSSPYSDRLAKTSKSFYKNKSKNDDSNSNAIKGYIILFNS
jgi:hypothetical protein